ncbi:hypothetical protein F3Y22_tig00111582pilonHSYRG01394 [Hibiscus syriacus]|uniref:Ionotropic glutamate receptor C-terminal domain-containing protein n=1 Tax=Hibiscus syriacus TaxID=106335 RepID=A0A6A2XM29_HIBSY|nr:hypothetical protein F3Y22_tig00111582pilonHSYRG01394 [Hibiscus syriacus]
MILQWMMMMACCRPWLLSLKRKNIRISFVAAINGSSEDDQIIEQLDELNRFRTGVFIVHLLHSVSSRLFMNAKRLGMMSKGYAWIVTSKTMDHFDSLSSAIDRSMEGVIGFRSHIPISSSELQNFTSRLRRMFDAKDQQSAVDFSLGLLAYDNIDTSFDASPKNIINFKGLGGEFRFINGKCISKKFEIVNVVDNGAKKVGFCTSTEEITNRRRRRLSDDLIDNLEPIIWPGGSLTVPQGRQARMLQTRSGKILRIGVPYEFIPFMDANGNSAGTYTDLINQVYLKKFDAVVGDTTITSSRSLFVDFTISFTDIGVGVIYKPLTPKLWLAIIVFHILSGFVMWMIERQTSRSRRLSAPNNRPPLHPSWSFYTATLASMMTVQHMELHSKKSYIGYLGGSNITQGVLINNMNFNNDTMKPFLTADEYADALSKGSTKGGVSAILDEMPYIKIFLSEHSGDYSLIKSLPITNGFAFVSSPWFPTSREIAKLRESGKLDLLENAWFKSRTSLTKYKDDDASKVGPLTLENFGGLFLISAALSGAAFLMFQLPSLYHSHFHLVKIWTMGFVSIIRRRIEIFVKIFPRRKMIRSAAIHPQVQIT